MHQRRAPAWQPAQSETRFWGRSQAGPEWRGCHGRHRRVGCRCHDTSSGHAGAHAHHGIAVFSSTKRRRLSTRQQWLLGRPRLHGKLTTLFETKELQKCVKSAGTDCEPLPPSYFGQLKRVRSHTTSRSILRIPVVGYSIATVGFWIIDITMATLPGIGAPVRILPEGYRPYFRRGRSFYFARGVRSLMAVGVTAILIAPSFRPPERQVLRKTILTPQSVTGWCSILFCRLYFSLRRYSHRDPQRSTTYVSISCATEWSSRRGFNWELGRVHPTYFPDSDAHQG